MSLLPRGLALVVFSVGTLLVPSSRPIPVSTPGGGAPPVSREVKYTPLDKEFYLAADQLDYVRPGVKITILGVTNVAPGKKPVVEISITDSLNQPLDRLGALTPGPVTPGFVLASWDADKRQYFAYTTRTTERRDESQHRPERHVDGSRARALQVHLRDDAAGRLRRHEDADARRPGAQGDAGRGARRQDLLRGQRVQGLPGGRRGHDAPSGTPSTPTRPATTATTRWPCTGASGAA